MKQWISSRGWAAALIMVLITAGALGYAGAQAGTAVEVVSGAPLRVGAEAAASTVVETATPVETGGSGGLPLAALSADFHNFGVVGSTAQVRRDFLLANRGSAPLRVERAYTTCGCATAEISAAVIPPGKAARITLTFDAAFHPAPGQTVRRGLILETNDPARPVLEIWVQASLGK